MQLRTSSAAGISTADHERFLLTSVAIVSRARTDAIPALAHVTASISAFADASASLELWQAAATGDLPLLQRVHAMRSPVSVRGSRPVERALEAAAERGHLHVVQWLHAAFPTRSGRSRALDLAAEHGHLDVVCWLHTASQLNETLDRASMAAMDEAAKNGHLDVVRWLHTHRTEGCTTRAMDCAAGNGHLSVVQWLHTHRNEGCTTQAMDWAARTGHLEVVQWLHTHRREGCSSVAIDGAAANGHLDVVVWLREHRQLKWSKNAESGAAARGHVHVLEWLRLHAAVGPATTMTTEVEAPGRQAQLPQIAAAC